MYYSYSSSGPFWKPRDLANSGRHMALDHIFAGEPLLDRSTLQCPAGSIRIVSPSGACQPALLTSSLAPTNHTRTAALCSEPGCEAAQEVTTTGGLLNGGGISCTDQLALSYALPTPSRCLSYDDKSTPALPPLGSLLRRIGTGGKGERNPRP